MTSLRLKSAVAGRVIAGATHGVLVGESVERLEAAPIESLIVTNTVHVPDAKRIDKLTVLSIASLMAQAIRRIHTGESVGELFSPR